MIVLASASLTTQDASPAATVIGRHVGWGSFGPFCGAAASRHTRLAMSQVSLMSSELEEQIEVAGRMTLGHAVRRWSNQGSKAACAGDTAMVALPGPTATATATAEARLPIK